MVSAEQWMALPRGADSQRPEKGRQGFWDPPIILGGVRLVACPQVLIPDGEPDARARPSSERCLPLDPFVASDIPDGRRPFDLQKPIKN